MDIGYYESSFFYFLCSANGTMFPLSPLFAQFLMILSKSIVFFLRTSRLKAMAEGM